MIGPPKNCLGAVAGLALLVLSGCGWFRGTERSADGEPLERVAEKGPVKLIVRVAPREPRLSDLVDMDVIVESQPGVEIKPPAFGQAVGDFLIRDYSERPAPPGEPQARRFHYQLEPAHAGQHLIRSISIEFVDKRPDSEGSGQPVLVETDPMEVNVTSELGAETPDLASLEPMLPPQALPEPAWSGWLAAAGAGTALVAFVVWVRRRRKKRGVEPRPRTPEEVAHAALQLLLAENLPARGLFKDFYLRLTGIVRQYIEDTTGIRAPEQTTEEFLRDMRARETFPAQRSVQLAEFLEAADMVKYAGQQPGAGQIDGAIMRAREFVDLKPAQSVAATSRDESAGGRG